MLHILHHSRQPAVDSHTEAVRTVDTFAEHCTSAVAVAVVDIGSFAVDKRTVRRQRLTEQKYLPEVERTGNLCSCEIFAAGDSVAPYLRLVPSHLPVAVAVERPCFLELISFFFDFRWFKYSTAVTRGAVSIRACDWMAEVTSCD